MPSGLRLCQSMTANVLLIARDRRDQTSPLLEALNLTGHRVQEADRPVPGGGFDAVILAHDNNPADLIRVCRRTAGLEQTPMLVWLGREGEIAAALGQGADDCVAGTAGLPEVLARISALLRRARQDHGSTVFSLGRVQVDLRRGYADVGSGAVALTPKELSLFHYLASRAGSIVARDELLREVWGYAVAATRTVDTHMSALRRKLESNPRRPEHLLTVRGRGYQFRG
jgi:DNA-binding response OmpR family regulator